MHPDLKDTALALIGAPAIIAFALVAIPLGMPVVSCVLQALGVAR